MPVPTKATRDAVLACLITDFQIAEKLGTTVSTVRTWDDRYEDMPPYVLGDKGQTQYRWWPHVEKFCEKNSLPRWKRRAGRENTDAMP